VDADLQCTFNLSGSTARSDPCSDTVKPEGIGRKTAGCKTNETETKEQKKKDKKRTQEKKFACPEDIEYSLASQTNTGKLLEPGHNKSVGARQDYDALQDNAPGTERVVRW